MILPVYSKIMLDQNINPLLRYLQINFGYIPETFKPKNLLLKAGVMHQDPLLGDSFSHIITHGEVGRTGVRLQYANND
jgi:hypothetical protein